MLKVENASLGMTTRFCNNGFCSKLKQVFPQAVNEMASRVNKPGQFLSWADLPKLQLQRVDAIYAMVEKLRQQSPAEILTVLGIGGSKHTVEHMLGVNGLNIKGDKVKFFSDIDSVSFNRFMQELDGDAKKSNYLVASKSGSTFETKDGMLRIIDKLKEAYKRPPYRENISKHMIAVTDKNPESQLRKFSNQYEWLGDLYIHDDVGGRFSALDDHSLFTLAWAGIEKEDMIKMLNGAQDMTDIALLPYPTENTPLMQAAFWAQARIDGIKCGVHQYLGDMFSNTATWHTQMQNESIKDSLKQIAKITDAMHHSSEGWYNPENEYAFQLTAPVDHGFARENTDGYIGAIAKTNAAYGPSMVETLETTELGLKPETAGAMSQARSFATVYQGILERFVKGESQPEVLPEVLQPNVEAYKKNLKPIEGNEPPVEAGRISLIA